MNTQSILLASHGTQGALAAVQATIDISQPGGSIHHLVVVPELWKGMTGDDWLNNGATRDRFRRYLESQIGREIDEHCDLVQQQLETKGVHYQRQIVVGDPDKCLIEYSTSHPFDLVVIGSPRPKGVSGLRSRMNCDSLAKGLTIPLLVVPFPDV